VSEARIEKPRSDVARNRLSILTAARAMSAASEPLQLNAVAHRAGVGVGTVYRHFPSPEALSETLAADTFSKLLESAASALAQADAAAAIRTLLDRTLSAYLSDEFFAAVIGSQTNLQSTRELKVRFLGSLETLFDRARAANQLRIELTAADAFNLLCGVGYAVRNASSSPMVPADLAAKSRYLQTLLDGMFGASDPGE
jgi:AcrR family transcriptional regulator